jgi:5-methylcytosine-specific restriction enzyme subunit McrC
VSSADWSFLEKSAFSNEKNHRFIRLASRNGKKALQVVNFVGVVSTPSGTHIEILPKTTEASQNVEVTRKLLLKLLYLAGELPFIETTDTSLQLHKKSLPEVLINRFLSSLASVVRQGIRKDYHRIESEEPFLKGKLQIAQQLRQPVGKQHLFQIAYDVFSENRAENRLIHSALIQVSKWIKTHENQKLARELRFAFNDVPKSNNYETDFRLWKNTRDMISYRALFPWVKLILNQQSPFTLKDKHAGISFLFPMEKLFEQYVAKMLQKYLGYVVKTQLQQHHLLDSPKAFLLKPDLAIYDKSKLLVILDTKWKLIDQNTQYDNGNEDPKSGISQADMYQMFAYGKKHFKSHENGKLVLIYPHWGKFNNPLRPFKFDDTLTLDVIPFDLTIDLNNSGEQNNKELMFKHILKIISRVPYSNLTLQAEIA